MEVGKIDSFQDNKYNISKDYDYNKDGTVDIQDYNYALLSLQDDDTENDINVPKDELDKVFANLIADDNTVNPDTEEINGDNVNQLSEDLLKEAETKLKNPEDATTFNELQTIGQNLSRIIKRCTRLLPVLNQQIEIKNEELAELEKEKEEKEKEYNQYVSTVESKNNLLSEKFEEVLVQTDIVTNEIKNNTSQIIRSCVDKYKSGEYPNKDLYSVIVQELAGNNPSSMAALNSKILETDYLGNEIKDLCVDIEGIVGEIRTITSNFNDVTASVNTLKANRNSVLNTSTKASAEYQKGYQKRLDLRQEYIDKYSASGSDAQLAAMSSFLDTCSDMPFADAFAILAGIGNQTGIVFGYGSMQMPTFTYDEGDEDAKAAAEAQAAQYNSLAEKVRSVFGDDTVTKAGSDNEEEFLNPTESDCFNGCSNSSCTEIPKTTSCDPISFTHDGVTNHFIIDRDNDGVLDDASEFLGAKDGWDEMVAFDKDGNGIIEGSELDDLKMVSVDNSNGQFTFKSAKEAGISSIDLSTYQEKGSMDASGDVLQGEFKINMKDGTTVNAEHTDDYTKNIDLKYGSLFGSKIEDLSDEYEDNVFMDEFVEKISTDATVANNDGNSLMTKMSSENQIADEKNSGKGLASKNTDETKSEIKRKEEKKEQ